MTKAVLSLSLATSLFVSNAQAAEDFYREYFSSGLPESVLTVRLADSCPGQFRARRLRISSLSSSGPFLITKAAPYEGGAIELLLIEVGARKAKFLSKSLENMGEVQISLEARYCEQGLEQSVFGAHEVLSAL